MAGINMEYGVLNSVTRSPHPGQSYLPVASLDIRNSTIYGPQFVVCRRLSEWINGWRSGVVGYTILYPQPNG